MDSMKDNQKDDTYDPHDLSTVLLELLQSMNVPPDVAYAALGTSFARMHYGVGKGKAEWMETCTQMRDLLHEPELPI